MLTAAAGGAPLRCQALIESQPGGRRGRGDRRARHVECIRRGTLHMRSSVSSPLLQMAEPYVVLLCSEAEKRACLLGIVC